MIVKRLPRKRWLILAAGLVGLLVVAWLLRSRVPPAALTAQAKRGPFVATLLETGEVQAVRSRSIAAPFVRGKLQIVKLAEEGSFIKEGDTIARFDSTELESQIRDQEAELRKTESEIAKRKADLAGEEKDLETAIALAEIAQRRAELSITEGDLIPRLEQEKARLALQEAEAQRENTESRVENKRVSAQADLSILEGNRQKAMSALERQRRDLASLEVKAPADGLVVYPKQWMGDGQRSVKEGDTVWPGHVMAELPDLTEMEVGTQVNEVDVSRVSVGQRAQVRLDAYPGPIYNGKVGKVSNLATEKEYRSRVKVFEVTINLEETAPQMKPGMTAQVEIILEELPDTVSVPREAVFDKDQGPVVYLVRRSGYKERPVTLGVTSATHVVVREGLSGGERVYLYDPTAEKQAQPPAAPASDAPARAG